MIRHYLGRIDKIGDDGFHVLAVTSESSSRGRNALVGIRPFAHLALLYDRSGHFEVMDDPEIKSDFDKVARGERVEGIENYGVVIPNRRGTFSSSGRKIGEVYCRIKRFEITKNFDRLGSTIEKFVVDTRTVELPRPVEVKTLAFKGRKDYGGLIMDEILEKAKSGWIKGH